ncbi:thiamine-phosphate kinase [Pseudoxanthomonas japonensis]|uniref:Thiamine-monophosphate kinase n=1 Tax=Pseudoxanthomonas japonensis TaxID=69284 RepID=A0ABQ6ZJZ9_9GAMM|nr:thiamine-phosphate kinase [Pseudoxanthomonas japonensis]KAF1726478.1 thiamine-phosphate kinase [Pseudoxanthomonas japonensis]
MGAGEFDLIARIRARAGTRDDIVLGIGDDAALLAPPPGRHLVVTADTLNDGVHFPHGTLPADLGWKALAVNLSDLASMGAEPAWCTLSLSLPQGDTAWIDGFLDGFLALAREHGIVLVGGDTTRGPLSVSVTAMGFVDAGRALRRDGARVGDDVWVTGTLGDAAGALALLERDPVGVLRLRLDRPTPRVEAGRALVGIATACVDVSDGLLADLGHIVSRSGVAAQVDVGALPVSEALRASFDEATRLAMQAGGGDDYELCFTAPPEARAGIDAVSLQFGLRITRIGRIMTGEGVHPLDADGRTWSPPRRGYDHFAAL